MRSWQTANKVLFVALVCVVPLNMKAKGDTCSHETDSVREMRSVEVAVKRFTSPIRSRADGTRSWKLSSLHELPKILGNTDPLHMTELLPGVQTTSEYDSGLHIWGCDNAHNEVSLDGTPLYGVQHLFGFFSVFNSAHFQTMTFAPSASLASTSNRLGGLLRMETTERVAERRTGELSIGPMSSQGTLRLPIGKHTMLLVSARESYLNLLYSYWLKIDDEQMRYSFGDYNLTLLHQFSDRDRLRLNAYVGHDRAGFNTGLYQADATMKWGNQLASLEHHHVFNDSLTLTHAISFSRFANQLMLNEQEISLSIPSYIMDIGYRGALHWKNWRFGLDASTQRIQPQSPNYTDEKYSNTSTSPIQQVQQYNLHAQYVLDISGGWTLRPSLKGTLYVDDLRKVHLLPSPSFSVEWQTSRAGTFSFHYAWQHQPLFQTGITTMGLPVEFWVATGSYGKPQEAQHVSLSHEIVFGGGGWSLSTGAYFKYLKHQTEYKGNVLDFMNTHYDLHQSLLYGWGYNYGVNVMLSKRTGSVTGWVSYAFGRSMRYFDDPSYPDIYPSNHDRPHEVNALVSWRFAKRWSVGATFVFCSGTPYTAPKNIYLMNHTLMIEEGAHNAKRLKPYKRLDLSVNFDIKHTTRIESGINFSLYNAACFNNELFYRIDLDEESFSYSPSGFILPLLPSINYYIKWK